MAQSEIRYGVGAAEAGEHGEFKARLARALASPERPCGPKVMDNSASKSEPSRNALNSVCEVASGRVA